MAAGLAVVSTRHGGIPEIIDDGVSGLLVPPRETEALADALTLLIGDASRSAAIGNAARETFEQRFTATKFEDTLAGVLTEIASPGRPSDAVAAGASRMASRR